jgi:TolB-like protein
MLNGNDRQSGVSDRVNRAFRPLVRCSGSRSGLAIPNATEKGPIARAVDDKTISDEAIREELSRILESSMFVQSDRLSRFLQFTVKKTLAGEGDMLKEYLIGTEVYDRPTSYRPSEDSIVRSEARRLRSKLKEYYESVGQSDPVVIDYRLGSYAPVFRNQSRQGSHASTVALLPSELDSRGPSVRTAVLPFFDASGSAWSGVYAELITDELIHELVRTDGIRVTATSSVAPLVAKAVDICSLARHLDVQVVFEGTVRQDDNLLRITFRAVDAADGFQIWSERIETEPDLRGVPAVSERIVASLVSRIRPQLKAGREMIFRDPRSASPTRP